MKRQRGAEGEYKRLDWPRGSPSPTLPSICERMRSLLSEHGRPGRREKVFSSRPPRRLSPREERPVQTRRADLGRITNAPVSYQRRAHFEDVCNRKLPRIPLRETYEHMREPQSSLLAHLFSFAFLFQHGSSSTFTNVNLFVQLKFFLVFFLLTLMVILK